ncbi:hypothetical protein [Frigoriglobus tundricola]|uniref:Uncharacterized protein n=1 Tax=Frigoriglobus tundricola TaxID=2774151 RepID=A0A6M5Z4L1_9BACT|nr:hypothetical protein [Frigoriglobus tundricola]QJX01169.1 hypothetical protein FTUN_8808 [Frigoriglobus tundricola]
MKSTMMKSTMMKSTMMKSTLLLLPLLAAGVGCQKQLPEPPEAAAGDPRSVAAQKMAEQLAGQEKQVIGLGDKVMQPVKLTRAADRLVEIKKVKELKDAYGSALVTLHALDEATLALDRELRHAGASYGAGAQCFRDRAGDYRDGKLKDACGSWAGHYEGLRDRVPYHRERVAALRKELPRTLELMRQSGQILDDYYLFVSQYPGETLPDTVAAPYVQNVKEYVRQFEGFEAALESYRKGGN